MVSVAGVRAVEFGLYCVIDLSRPDALRQSIYGRSTDRRTNQSIKTYNLLDEHKKKCLGNIIYIIMLLQIQLRQNVCFVWDMIQQTKIPYTRNIAMLSARADVFVRMVTC